MTGCKGLSVGLKEIFNEEYTYSIWLTFFCAIVIIFCIIIQMVYLNRALDLFSTPIVTTIYYVLFTTCVLITSGILFREWKKLTFIDIMACIVGFLIITSGLVLINNLKTNLQSSKRKRKKIFLYKMIDDYLDALSFPYSTSISNVKQQQEPQHHTQVKSYANLLVNDDNLSSKTNSLNEQCQAMLLIDERDLNS